jgi:hypothetical protein
MVEEEEEVDPLNSLDVVQHKAANQQEMSGDRQH